MLKVRFINIKTSDRAVLWRLNCEKASFNGLAITSVLKTVCRLSVIILAAYTGWILQNEAKIV